MEIGNQNNGSVAATAEDQTVVDEAEILQPLEIDIEALREQLASERDARLRLAAEYKNYRRRTKRENAQAAKEGKRELLERLLSIADDLELTCAHLDGASDAVVAEGVKLVRRRFDEMLRANQVTSFQSEGEVFDPQRHEAFDVVDGKNLTPGTVHSEIRRGYFWGEKLLRPALVVVAA